MTHLFVRSQSNQSRIYYSYQQWEKGVWSSFVPIGDDKNFLMYDFDVVVNTFVWVSAELSQVVVLFSTYLFCCERINLFTLANNTIFALSVCYMFIFLIAC